MQQKTSKPTSKKLNSVIKRFQNLNDAAMTELLQAFELNSKKALALLDQNLLLLFEINNRTNEFEADHFINALTTILKYLKQANKE